MKVNIKHFYPHYEKKKKSHWKAWTAFILLLICAGSIIYTLNLPAYQIKSVEVHGAVLTDESAVNEIAVRSISERYFYLIPRSLVWAYPKSSIKKEIKAILSVLDVDIKVDRESGILKISLTERAQKYLWCMPDKVKCYYMDQSGRVFTEAPALEGNVFVVFSGLITDLPLGAHFLPADKMVALVDFMSVLRDFGFQIKAVNATSINEVHIILQSGADLIISLEKPLDNVITNLKILKESPDFASASGGIERLQYIDLRYGAKAFWK